MFSKTKKNIFILLLTVSLSGCAALGSYNAATNRRELIFIPTDQEIVMGEETHKQLQQQYKFSQDPQKLARVKRIGTKVSQVSDRQDYPYHFYLIEKDEFNAFTTPGGNVYVFSQLLDNLKSDDEVASVLAHEVGHCAARHTIKKFQAALGYNLVGSLVFRVVQMGPTAQRIAQLSSGAVMNLIFSAYSRQDELEADRLGIKYLDLSGYDVNAMISTFELLKQKAQGPDVPELLMSHPHLDDRIVAAKKEIEKIKAQD